MKTKNILMLGILMMLPIGVSARVNILHATADSMVQQITGGDSTCLGVYPIHTWNNTNYNNSIYRYYGLSTNDPIWAGNCDYEARSYLIFEVNETNTYQLTLKQWGHDAIPNLYRFIDAEEGMFNPLNITWINQPCLTSIHTREGLELVCPSIVPEGSLELNGSGNTWGSSLMYLTANQTYVFILDSNDASGYSQSGYLDYHDNRSTDPTLTSTGCDNDLDCDEYTFCSSLNVCTPNNLNLTFIGNSSQQGFLFSGYVFLVRNVTSLTGNLYPQVILYKRVTGVSEWGLSDYNNWNTTVGADLLFDFVVNFSKSYDYYAVVRSTVLSEFYGRSPIITVAAGVSSNDYTDVSVHVLDGGSINQTGNLSKVRIALNNFVNYTDDFGNGFFHLPGVISSFYISLTKTNYTGISQTFTANGNVIPLTFVMYPLTSNLISIQGKSFLDTKYGACVPDGTKITLSGIGCNNGGQNICGITYTFSSNWTGNISESCGHFRFDNLIYKPVFQIRADSSDSQYESTGWQRITNVSNPIINPVTYFYFLGLLTVGGSNMTNGTVYLKGLVTEKNTNPPFIIQEGSFDYSIISSNGTSSRIGRLSNGYVILQNLRPGDILIIKFDIPNYEKKSFTLNIGSGNFLDDDLFILAYNGPSTTIVTTTTTIPGQTTTTIPGQTTTTLYTPSNITIYQFSNRSLSLITNAYDITFNILESICGALTVVTIFIVIFIALVLVLLANMVLKSLGWKWSFIFGGK